MDVNAIIGFLSFLCALVLPIAVLIVNDLDKGLKLDRHLIVADMLKLPYLVASAAFIGVSVLLMTLFNWQECKFLQIVVIIASIIFFILIFRIIISAVNWLNSEEFSTETRNSYKEKSRIKYLNDKNAERSAILWREFWNDPQSYAYFDSERILPYLEAYITHLEKMLNLPKKTMEDLQRSTEGALYKIHQTNNNFLGYKVAPMLLETFNDGYRKDEKRQKVAIHMVQVYIRVLQDPPKEATITQKDYASPAISAPEEWRWAFIACLVDDPVVTERKALKEITNLIIDSIKNSDRVVEYKRKINKLAKAKGNPHCEFYKALSKSLKNNDETLTQYLLECSSKK